MTGNPDDAVQRIDEPHGARLVLKGDVDPAEAAVLRRHLGQILRPGRHVDVDMAEVTFFSSTGLAALIDGYSDAVRIGASLTVVNPSVQVQRVFDLTSTGGTLSPGTLSPGGRDD